MSQADLGLTEEAFYELFGEAVIVGLTNIVGPSGMQATIKHMGMGNSPSDPDKIDASLVTIFSKPGAVVIERQIIKALFEKLDERFLEGSRMNFREKVEEVKHRFETLGGEGA